MLWLNHRTGQANGSPEGTNECSVGIAWMWLHKLSGTSLEYAPAGGQHEIRFDNPQSVHIEVLRALTHQAS